MQSSNNIFVWCVCVCLFCYFLTFIMEKSKHIQIKLNQHYKEPSCIHHPASAVIIILPFCIIYTLTHLSSSHWREIMRTTVKWWWLWWWWPPVQFFQYTFLFRYNLHLLKFNSSVVYMFMNFDKGLHSCNHHHRAQIIFKSE